VIQTQRQIHFSSQEEIITREEDEGSEKLEEEGYGEYRKLFDSM
jgi:hypothetical protein